MSARSFLIGIVLIGIFILAGAFIDANKVHASTGLIKLYGSYIINAGGTPPAIRGGSYSTATNTAVWTNQTGAGTATTFRSYAFIHPNRLSSTTGAVVTNLYFTYVKENGCATAVTYYSSSTANPSDFDNGSSVFDTASTSGYKDLTVTASDRTNSKGIGLLVYGGSAVQLCKLTVTSVTDNLGTQYLVVDQDSPSNSSTTTIPLYTPLLKDKLLSMNCTYTTTTTTCTPTYASTTIPVTPTNALALIVIFMIATGTMYWIVRKLS